MILSLRQMSINEKFDVKNTHTHKQVWHCFQAIHAHDQKLGMGAFWGQKTPWW